MARNEQLIRQHKLLQLLEMSRFGKTLDELRDDLVSDLGLTTLHERTVRRDVEALQAAGFDIQSETLERGKVFKLGRNNKGVHEIGISATELIALSIGRELLYPLLGTQYWRGIETFWNKVREVIPDGVFEHYDRYRKTLYVFGSPNKTYEQHEGMLKTLNRAILEHRVVEIQYASVGKPVSTRRIEPYGLAVYQSSIYVVATAPEVKEPSQRLRNWKLDRFRHAVALDEYFKPWHPEQRMELQDDGTSILTVPAAHPREVLPKVLSLGVDAEVLEPKEFRDAVAEAVQGMAAKY